MLKAFVVLSIFFFASLQSYAQVTQEWVNTSNQFDVVGSCTDANGNLYLGGSRYIGNGHYGLGVVKVLSTGAISYIITYVYSQISVDHCTAMCYMNNSRIILTGYYAEGNNPNSKIETIVRNINGSDIWRSFFSLDTMKSYQPVAVIADHRNNTIVAGHSWNNFGQGNALILKYDFYGNLIWNQEIPLDQFYGANAAVDNLDNIIFTGKKYTSGSDFDIVTLKFDSTGTLLWSRTYDGPANQMDAPAKVNIDSRNNIIVAGSSDAINPYGYASDYVILKYNTAGDLIWERRFNGNYNSNDLLNDMIVDRSDNILVTGATLESVYEGQNIATIKYDSSGSMLWLVKYNHGMYDVGEAISIDTTGNVYVCGSQDHNEFTSDFVTLSLDKFGQQRWVASYNAPFNDNDDARKITVTDRGYLFVSGYTTSQNGYDATFIKYSQPIGIQQISSEVPKRFSLSQNYPNPFNPSTKIKFAVATSPLSLGEGLGVRLIIYDVLGREVATLVKKQLSPGTYEADWDAANFPSGVYFYKLVSGDYSETKKMVLMK